MNKQCVLERSVVALVFITDVNNETIMIDFIAHC